MRNYIIEWHTSFHNIVLYRIAVLSVLGDTVKNKKIVIVLTLVVVLVIIGVIGWILISFNTLPELSIQEQVRDDTMIYIKSSHPETSQLMNNLVWTGGRTTPENIIGAETYTYLSQGWNVTIQYPVILNPVYKITADYSVVPDSGVAIPYRVIWQGNWENGSVTETSYTFAQ